MERTEFVRRCKAVAADRVPTEEELKTTTKRNARETEEDLAICIGELAELTLELTRFQRNKMDPEDLLQELSHVQWVVWRLQNMFSVDDVKLRTAIQASFR